MVEHCHATIPESLGKFGGTEKEEVTVRMSLSFFVGTIRFYWRPDITRRKAHFRPRLIGHHEVLPYLSYALFTSKIFWSVLDR